MEYDSPNFSLSKKFFFLFKKTKLTFETELITIGAQAEKKLILFENS